MAKFSSNEEAKIAIIENTEHIAGILNKDLYPIEESKRTIELWFEIYGKITDYSKKKEKLITFEMNLTDAEIYILHHETLRENVHTTTNSSSGS